MILQIAICSTRSPWMKVLSFAKRLCFNCLRPTNSKHTSTKKHHALLHRSLPSNQKEEQSGQVKAQSGLQTGMLARTLENRSRLLPTALAKIRHGTTILEVRVLIDSGSDHSYIREDLANALQLKALGPPKQMTIFMHGGQETRMKVTNVGFQLSALDNTHKTKFSAWTVKKVCSPLEAVTVDLSCYSHLSGLQLADNYPRGKVTVNVLIGADQWSEVMLNGIKKAQVNTPVAMNSIFGWLVSGCLQSTSKEPSHNSITNCAVMRLEEDVSEDFDLKKFWELEFIGIEGNTSKEETPGYEHFQSNVTFDGQRYEISLPWKETNPTLKSNLSHAVKRLEKMEERLKEDPRRKVMYNDAMKQYFRDGHATEVKEEDTKTTHPTFYLPHHPVFREDRVTTKCRVVFDASARNYEGISLNDCLHPGPSLHRNLISIILRFRLHKIAMMADIKKMFLQIKMAEKDQHALSFLWREEPHEEPRKFYMTRVTFGLVCSPFQDIATVRNHATKNIEVFRKAAQDVLDNLYVDDYLGGEETVEDYTMISIKRCALEYLKWSSGILIPRNY